MRIYINFNLLSAAVLAVILEKVNSSATEVQLVNRLFQSYNSLIRPARNVSDVITICFGLSLIQLITIDERNQVMKSNVWLRMRWIDYQLAWHKEDYDNISVIRMAPERVWQPDIVLFNNADGKYEVSYKSRVLLYGDSETVVFIPPAIYKSSCNIDVQYFPFDEQRCEMKFGSWTFNAEQVDIEFEEGFKYVDLSDYVLSGTWDVVDCPGFQKKIIGVNGEPNRTRIEFTIVLRRKTLFYTVNLIIPCVLISFLSICVFYLPTDAGEKMTLSISILLALVVFLLLLQKILPPTSKTIPLIASYLLFTFILNIISIVVTVVIINWSFRTPRTHVMPRWVRVVFLDVLPKFLLMAHPQTESPLNGNNQEQEVKHEEIYASPYSMAGAVPNQFGFGFNYRQDRGDPHVRHRFLRPSVDFSPDGAPRRVQMTREIYKTVQAIRYIAHHMKKDDDYDQVLKDWKYVGLVIDRLLLAIFLAVTTGGTIGIFINSPHIFDFVEQQKIIDRLREIKTEAQKIPINSCFSGDPNATITADV